MRKILHKTSALAKATVTVTLEHAERQKSRGLLRLDDGTEAALLLDRGTGGLQPGDKLLAEDGTVVLVQAALEGLSVVTAREPLDLARAAYHLGNRHIAVQINALCLAYQHDHVLAARARLSSRVRQRALRAGIRRVRAWARALAAPEGGCARARSPALA